MLSRERREARIMLDSEVEDLVPINNLSSQLISSHLISDPTH